MIAFLLYYIAGCLVFSIYLKFSKSTQAMFRKSLNTYPDQLSFAVTLWTYPVIWPVDVGYDLYRHYVKKVPLKDL